MLIIAPLIQLLGILYGVHNTNKQLNQSASDSIPSLLKVCKRDAIIFYAVFMVQVLVTISWEVSIVVHNHYLDVEYAYVFYFLFSWGFYLASTSYLAVVLLFLSLSLMEVQTVQQDIVKAIEGNQMSCQEYMIAKDKIKYIQRESYFSLQVLVATAAINVIAFIYLLYYFRPLFERSGISLTINLLFASSLLLKEVVFFFYILFKAASVNSNHDKLKEVLAKKCWDLGDKSSDGYQYMLMYQDALEFPTEVKLGPIKV